MSRYVDADYVKAVMLNDRLLQGNAEYELYKQKVDAQVKAMPTINIVRCRECKYAEVSVSPITGLWCTRFGINDMAMKADDFCSYGERNCSEKPNNSERSSE